MCGGLFSLCLFTDSGCSAALIPNVLVSIVKYCTTTTMHISATRSLILTENSNTFANKNEKHTAFSSCLAFSITGTYQPITSTLGLSFSSNLNCFDFLENVILNNILSPGLSRSRQPPLRSFEGQQIHKTEGHCTKWMCVLRCKAVKLMIFHLHFKVSIKLLNVFLCQIQP